MSAFRPPVVRLRAARGGRLSQFLDPNPTDELLQVDPPALKLNGKPVVTGGALDSTLRDIHNQRLALMFEVADARTSAKNPKATYQTFGPASVSPNGMAQAYAGVVQSILNSKVKLGYAAAAAAAFGSPLAVEVTLRRAQNFLAHTQNLPASNDNGEHPWPIAKRVVDRVDPHPPPFPADSLGLPTHLPGSDLYHNNTNQPANTPPFPATPPQLPEKQPDDPSQFNRPQIETIPIVEVDWRNLILYHNSSPDTEQDTTTVIQMMKRLLGEYGFRLDKSWSGREREYYFPGPDGGRKGSRYADAALAILIGDRRYLYFINTVDTLSDGTTPTLRERRAEIDINEKIRATQEEYAPLLMIPKSRGISRDEWEAKLEQQLKQYLQALFNRLAS